MNILQVTNYFKPSWESGGPARVVYEISKRLIKEKHKVTIFTTDGYKYRLNIEKNKSINVEGIEVYYFKNLSNYISRKMTVITPTSFPLIVKNELHKFDIIHIHEHRNFFAPFIYYYSNKYNIPYIIQAHGDMPIPNDNKLKIKTFYDKYLGMKILNNASKMIALNKTEFDCYLKNGIKKEKIEIIPNGINSSEIKEEYKTGYFKKKYSIKNEKIILYLGRIHESKGIDFLIDALPLIIKKYSNFKLILAGPDIDYVSTLKKKINKLSISKYIIFTGYIDELMKKSILIDSDIFVTPKFTGFPVTFIEACAFKTPIITTSEGDVLDWINNNVGYVTKYDKNEFADAIINLLINDKRRIEFGNKAKELVTRKFTWEIIVNELENIYQKCISKKT